MLNIKEAQNSIGALLLIYPNALITVIALKFTLDLFMKEGNNDPLYEKLKTASEVLNQKLGDIGNQTPQEEIHVDSASTNTTNRIDYTKQQTQFPLLNENEHSDAVLNYFKFTKKKQEIKVEKKRLFIIVFEAQKYRMRITRARPHSND